MAKQAEFKPRALVEESFRKISELNAKSPVREYGKMAVYRHDKYAQMYQDNVLDVVNNVVQHSEVMGYVAREIGKSIGESKRFPLTNLIIGVHGYPPAFDIHHFLGSLGKHEAEIIDVFVKKVGGRKNALDLIAKFQHRLIELRPHIENREIRKQYGEHERQMIDHTFLNLQTALMKLQEHLR